METKELTLSTTQFLKNTGTVSIVTDDDGYQSIKFEDSEIPLSTEYLNVGLVQAAQATKGSGLKPGQFRYFATSGTDPIEGLDPVDALYLIPIKVWMISRRCYAPYDAKNPSGNSLLCYSQDCLRPAQNVNNPFSTQCAIKNIRGYLQDVCEKSLWRDNTPPQCRLQKSVAFLDVVTMLPVVMTLHGTALSSFHKFIRTIELHRNLARFGKGGTSNDGPRNIVRITSESQGQYYALLFKLITDAEAKKDKVEVNSSQQIKIAQYYGETLFSPREDSAIPDNEPTVSAPAIEIEPESNLASEINNLDDAELPF